MTRLAVDLKISEKRSTSHPFVNDNSADLAADIKPKLKEIDVPEYDVDNSKFRNWKALFVSLVH